MYLMRCTTTFTPIRTFIVIACLIISSILQSYSNNLLPASKKGLALRLIFKIPLVIAAIVAAVIVVLCLIKYYKSHKKKNNEKIHLWKISQSFQSFQLKSKA